MIKVRLNFFNNGGDATLIDTFKMWIPNTFLKSTITCRGRTPLLILRLNN